MALLLLATLVVGAAHAAEEAAATPTGLRVGPGATLWLGGAPCRGIGMNYFSAFSRTLAKGDDTSYLEGLDVLRKWEIPFIRFMACGFWPKDWALYLEDSVEYFRRFDAFVKAAEDRGLGLIPSLLWFDATVPDLVGEPRNQWGDPESKTMAFMRRYVGEVVSRYVHSTAIWAWELGNEYNLSVDLPNAADHRPPLVPHWGSPATRSEADDMTHDMIVTAFTEFAKEVRRYDAARPITTGNSIPRPAAHHMRIEQAWTHDTPQEFAENLIAVTPEPMSLVSIHMYPDARKRFGRENVPYEQLLALCLDAAADAGKALFVGEFGASDAPDAGGLEAARTEIAAQLSALEHSGVPLAAFWVFDLAQQGDSTSVSETNQRGYVLSAIRDTNRRIWRSTATTDAP